MNTDHKPGEQVLVRGEIRGKHTRNIDEILEWTVMFIDHNGLTNFAEVRTADIVAPPAGPVGQEQVDYRDAEIRKLRARISAALELADSYEDTTAADFGRAFRRALTGGEDSGGEE